MTKLTNPQFRTGTVLKAVNSTHAFVKVSLVSLTDKDLYNDLFCDSMKIYKMRRNKFGMPEYLFEGENYKGKNHYVIAESELLKVYPKKRTTPSLKTVSTSFPKLWCIKPCDKLRAWMRTYDREHPKNHCSVNFSLNSHYYYPNPVGQLRKWDYPFKSKLKPKGYTEITFAQFEQNVLKIKKPLMKKAPISKTALQTKTLPTTYYVKINSPSQVEEIMSKVYGKTSYGENFNSMNRFLLVKSTFDGRHLKNDAPLGYPVITYDEWVSKSGVKKGLVGYELIKPYPGSYKLGTFIKVGVSHSFKFEENPEFWKPVYKTPETTLTITHNQIDSFDVVITPGEKIVFGGKTIPVEFIEKVLNLPKFNQIYGWEVTIPYINIGCKHNIRVSDAEKILKIYKSK